MLGRGLAASRALALRRCRCSLRGCRPSSPPATPVAVVVVSASGVLGVGGGFSCFFPRCREAWGSFCAGPGRPSWAVRGLAASRGVAVARRSTTTCCFSSTQEQEQPPGNTSNKLPQPPPKRKAPWKPRTDPLPPLPCRAGSRGWFSWRSLRVDRVCRDGPQRRPTSVACPRVRSASCKIHLPRAHDTSTERN